MLPSAIQLAAHRPQPAAQGLTCRHRPAVQERAVGRLECVQAGFRRHSTAIPTNDVHPATLPSAWCRGARGVVARACAGDLSYRRLRQPPYWYQTRDSARDVFTSSTGVLERGPAKIEWGFCFLVRLHSTSAGTAPVAESTASKLRKLQFPPRPSMHPPDPRVEAPPELPHISLENVQDTVRKARSRAPLSLGWASALVVYGFCGCPSR
jgi:hypothetical protein